MVIYLGLALPSLGGPPVVTSTRTEIHASGDFDGNGLMDAVVVETRPSHLFFISGNYRVGYQRTPGQLSWTRVRQSCFFRPAAAAVGRFLRPDRDALALTASDYNGIQIIDLPWGQDPDTNHWYEPMNLGPCGLAPVPSVGSASNALHDLLVVTEFNSPERWQLELLTPRSNRVAPMGSWGIPGAAAAVEEAEWGPLNTFRLRPKGPPLVGGLYRDSIHNYGTRKLEDPWFVAVDCASGRPEPVLRFQTLAGNSAYTVGGFGERGFAPLYAYAPDTKTLQRFRFTAESSNLVVQAATWFNLSQDLRALVSWNRAADASLVAVSEAGQRAAVLELDDAGGVQELQSIAAPPDLEFATLVPVGEHAVALFQRAAAPHSRGYTLAYQVWGVADGRVTAGPVQALPTPDHSVWEIHPYLQQRRDATDGTDAAAASAVMAPYTNTIPRTRVTYAMTPIPGGEFLMGTPTSEVGRQSNESPQVRVRIAPFWMATCEVSWDLFDVFQIKEERYAPRESAVVEVISSPQELLADAHAFASKPYVSMSFGMGRKGFPAIGMRPLLANRFCKWLSALTGHFYRLPTEAEWEYACRAGTVTAYACGDTPEHLEEFAWFENNSDFRYQKVGTKRPNFWGLYDMHGNVAELCLDQLTPDYAGVTAGALNPWTRPTRTFPTVVRGGSFDDPADRLRSGARQGTHPGWMMTDPQLPKCLDWFSDVRTVGFRFVRPLAVPADPEALSRWWSLDAALEPIESVRR